MFFMGFKIGNSLRFYVGFFIYLHGFTYYNKKKIKKTKKKLLKSLENKKVGVYLHSLKLKS